MAYWALVEKVFALNRITIQALCNHFLKRP